MRFGMSVTAKSAQLLPGFASIPGGSSRLQACNDLATAADGDGFAALLDFADEI